MSGSHSIFRAKNSLFIITSLVCAIEQTLSFLFLHSFMVQIQTTLRNGIVKIRRKRKEYSYSCQFYHISVKLFVNFYSTILSFW